MSISTNVEMRVRDRPPSRVPAPAANAVFAGVAFLPDFVLMPALGDVEPPWRWNRVELATSAIHHVVYAGGTIAAWTALERSV